MAKAKIIKYSDITTFKKINHNEIQRLLMSEQKKLYGEVAASKKVASVKSYA